MMSVSNLLPMRSISSAAELNAAIAAHLSADRLAAAVTAFSSNPHHRNTSSWNLLISGHARNGLHRLAENLFDEMPRRDIVSWNAILATHRLAGEPIKAFRRFVQMLRLDFRPTSSTFTTVISASPPAAVSQLHAAIVRSGHCSNTIVGTALMGGYTSSGDATALRRAFDDIPLKNCITWTALIAGFMRSGQTADARQAFNCMPHKTTVACTALISGYIAKGDLVNARLCFNAAENRNAFTWTAMVTGYLRHGCYSDALRLFSATPRPNRFTYSAALAASAKLCSLRSGESIHAQILKSGDPVDAYLATALVDMYGRCGEADAALSAFSDSANDSVAVWNAMIGAMGRNGRAVEATAELRRMGVAGVAPDETTLVNVLSACAHGGLVEEGEKLFETMEKEFSVIVAKEHYGCMVDLYGRAGMKEKAEAAAEAMPAGPDVAAAIAAAAAEGSVKLKEEIGAGGYSLMARVYGDRGNWKKVREMKERMVEAARRKGKQRGASWLERIQNSVNVNV